MSTYRCPVCGQEYRGQLTGPFWCSGERIIGVGLHRNTGNPRHDPAVTGRVEPKPSPLIGPYWSS